eukprot:1146478-Pelagomonas_calceolata.AAC.2
MFSHPDAHPHPFAGKGAQAKSGQAREKRKGLLELKLSMASWHHVCRIRFCRTMHAWMTVTDLSEILAA